MSLLLARSSRRPRRLLALAALVPIALWPAPGGAGEAPGSGGKLIRLGKVREIVLREFSYPASVAARPAGGFLVALETYDALLLGEYAEDGTREEMRRLGALGYGGATRLRTLEPLGGGAYAVAWDVDEKYSHLYSRTVFVDGSERHVSDSRRRFAPLLIADGAGGAIGFVLGPAGTSFGTWFGTWDASGRLLTQRLMRGVGQPWQVAPLGDGVLLVSLGAARGDGTFTEESIGWFTATGELLERTLSYRGSIVSDGEDRLAEVYADSHVVGARFGASPTGLGRFRTLVETPDGSQLTAFRFAMDRPDACVLAWSASPDPSGCAVWVRAFDGEGRALSKRVCAVRQGAELIALRSLHRGGFLLALLQRTEPGRRPRLWVRTLELAESPGSARAM